MNAVSLVKNSLIRAGNQSLRDVVCPCCREAVKEAMKICEDLNTQEDYHRTLSFRSAYVEGLVLSKGKCPTYKVTTQEIALIYERLRVLWKLGPVSLQAIMDVTCIVSNAAARN